MLQCTLLGWHIDLANGNVLKRPQTNFFYTIT